MLSKLILVLTLLVLPSFLVAKKVTDELEAKAGDVVIRLAGTKCTSKVVLEQLKPEFHDQFRKAEIRAKSKPVVGCWTLDATGVYVIFEDGSQGYVPTEMFKPVETL